MLGSAPGTDRLNEWVNKYNDLRNDGMSEAEALGYIANEIAESDAFIAEYPIFLTPGDFAEAFLDNLMGSEEVPAALMAQAVVLVTGLLNDGMTRGALALAAFQALYQIHDQGEAHAAYGDLGMVANGLFNKVAVAEYYTVDLRQASPNSRVLRDVNSETGLDDIRDSIGDHLDPAEPILLTNLRDNEVGTVANDRFLAEPDKNGNDTLDPFDTIDGGAGYDTLEVYTSDATVALGIDIDANHAQVSNVEHVYLSSRTGINADIAGWEGLESVELGRFGATHDVTVKVDGASVSTSRTFGGDVTIVGAAGEVSVMAGKTSVVKVGSGAHTTSVMTKGGMTVDVNANGAGGQSATVTSVMIDDVAGEGLGGDGKRGISMEADDVTVSATNADLTPSATVTQYVSADGTVIANDAANPTTKYYKAANQDVNGDTDGTGLDPGQVAVTIVKADAAQRAQVFKDGKRVDPGTEGAVNGTDSGGVPIHVNSDAIEHVSLSNTYATIAVVNKSKEAENLTVTVNKYGSAAVAGKFCITGDGAAENVSIMVAGDSNFALANNATKTVSVGGDGDLTLSVTNFVAPPTNVNAGGENTPAASTTLESITSSGSGKLTMDVAGTTKLKTIDGSASSGGSSIKGVHDAVTKVYGGSGNDAITVAGFHKDGLMVNLGAGNDTFSSAGGNDKSRVDGGEGDMDVLHLTGDSATHGKGDAKASIFSNFEVLEVGGSGAAAHDIKLLGVSAVSVSGSTTGTVTLNNMADGMGISVTGKAGMGTTATVVHDMADRKTGDPRYSGELNVSLTATGSKTDTAMSGSGQASLTLTADSEIEILNVASGANPAGKGAAATYQNSLVLMGGHTGAAGSETAVPSSVEAIVVSGSARAMVSLTASTVGTPGTVAQFENLELIDASDNTGGVTFSASVDVGGTDTVLPARAVATATVLEIIGGSGKDIFTGSAGVDKLMGGGGDDELNGGGGNDIITGGAGKDMLAGGTEADQFVFTGVADSNLASYDTIADFASADDDTIRLPKTLLDSFQGVIKTAAGNSGTTALATPTWLINANDAATANTANSLKAFTTANADGFFESRTAATDGGFGSGIVNKHSVAIVVEAYNRKATADELAANAANLDLDDDVTNANDDGNDSIALSRTWVLIDVNGDGDFNAEDDMVIALTGTAPTDASNGTAVTIASGDFMAIGA